jgi:hypothetical protein
LIIPYSVPYSWLNTIATATTEVTIGSRIASRKTSRPRRRLLSAFAIIRASNSCGTVAKTNMPSVLVTVVWNRSLVSRNS